MSRSKQKLLYNPAPAEMVHPSEMKYKKLFTSKGFSKIV
jgi:hypothetical protein